MRKSFASPRTGSEYGNFAFRIYNPEFSYANYDDDVIWVKEQNVNRCDLSIDEYPNSKYEIMDLFEEHLEVYQGATYCIKDLDTDEIIVGGQYDPQDIEVIERYFAQC